MHDTTSLYDAYGRRLSLTCKFFRSTAPFFWR